MADSKKMHLFQDKHKKSNHNYKMFFCSTTFKGTTAILAIFLISLSYFTPYQQITTSNTSSNFPTGFAVNSPTLTGNDVDTTLQSRKLRKGSTILNQQNSNYNIESDLAQFKKSASTLGVPYPPQTVERIRINCPQLFLDNVQDYKLYYSTGGTVSYSQENSGYPGSFDPNHIRWMFTSNSADSISCWDDKIICSYKKLNINLHGFPCKNAERVESNVPEGADCYCDKQ